jgi:hypothetical protein
MSIFGPASANHPCGYPNAFGLKNLCGHFPQNACAFPLGSPKANRPAAAYLVKIPRKHTKVPWKAAIGK